jgi:MFS family permease
MDAQRSANQDASDSALARRRSRQRGPRVVAGAAGIMFVTFGVTYSFSPFFASLQEQFGAQRGAVSLAFSIAVPLYFLFGLIGGPLADIFGPRKVALVGVLLGGGGLYFAAHAQALWRVDLGFGLGAGLGVQRQTRGAALLKPSRLRARDEPPPRGVGPCSRRRQIGSASASADLRMMPACSW